MPDWAIILAYLGVGLVVGLVAANAAYGECVDEPEFAAGLAVSCFIMGCLIWPLVVLACILLALFRAGAWLLPAYRKEKLRERALLQKEQEEGAQKRLEETRRELDRLHAKLGIVPIDWSNAQNR